MFIRHEGGYVNVKYDARDRRKTAIYAKIKITFMRHSDDFFYLLLLLSLYVLCEFLTFRDTSCRC